MADQIFKELAARITARERNHRETERWAWERHDYMTAIRVRGLADGLEEARDILLEVIAEAGAGLAAPGAATRHLCQVYRSETPG